MKQHVFTARCVDFEPILAEASIRKMLKVVFEQSKTEEAKKRVDFANYKDYDTDEFCPIYFGMFVEWLAWHFLNHYGHVFNIQEVEMTASIGASEKDYGIDGRGLSVKDQSMNNTGRKCANGSPVYVQVKGTMNSRKEYQANDGSRLTNFATNAMSDSIRSGYAYQARYLLFTTGQGIHFSLEEMTNKMFEIVNFKVIKRLIDKDTAFLNRMRISVGLTPFLLELSDQDPEAQFIQNLTKKSKNATI
jgi:hypothetical protein